MKITKSSSQVSQSSSGDTHQFKISANGTAFQILSSGLYSNKQAAVLRELACNAADAHVAAGIPKTPISVTLPTEKDRDLAIRDFGLGMSHEQILSLYTTYFSSDKRDSNAFVGGLGLGSKSPFAYTNSFTVTSIHKGVKRIYTCNIATDGAPTVTRLSEESTDEAQGVEVRLLTKQQDLHLFMREASNVFQWFDTPPTFNVDISFANSQESVFKTPAYDIGVRYGSSHFIKMGNVAYPLQAQSLDLPASTIWPKLIANIPLVLKAPIGHLQVAASREALQYDPTTKKNLLQLYQQAYNDIARQIVAEFSNPSHTSVWAQESAAIQWVHKHLTQPTRKLVSEMVAQSSSAVDAKKTADALIKVDPEVPLIAGNSSSVGVYWYGPDVTGRKTVERGLVSVGKNTTRAPMVRTPDTVIVVADAPQITEKIAHWRKERNLPCLLLVSPSTKKDAAQALSHANAISALLDGAPVLLLSKMPLVNIAVAPTIKRDYVEIYDRIVDVWDIAAGKSTSMPFRDVPADMRYALVRDTTTSKNSGVQFLESSVGTKNVLPEHCLQSWSSFFVYVQSQGYVWTGPKGAIVLRPVDVDRLKIQDAGVTWLLPSLCEAMLSKNNAPFAAFAETLWPKDQTSNPYYYNPAKTKMASGWLGDFGIALDQLRYKKKALQKELNDILEEAGMLTQVLARHASKSPAEDAAWNGYNHFMGTLRDLYPATQKVLHMPLQNVEQFKKFIGLFPLLGHVSSEVLFDAISKHKAGDARLQQVFILLRVCLNLPIGT